jgi:hypothetical protein
MNQKSDESYVIDLCDSILKRTARRQHRFEFLRGDPGKRGVSLQLPVDAYYDDLSLVVEYWERQHTEATAFMDKRMTCSGCDRREQRRRYDERKAKVLEERGIILLVLGHEMFACNSRKRLYRKTDEDIAVIRKQLQKIRAKTAVIKA